MFSNASYLSIYSLTLVNTIYTYRCFFRKMSKSTDHIFKCFLIKHHLYQPERRNGNSCDILIQLRFHTYCSKHVFNLVLGKNYQLRLVFPPLYHVSLENWLLKCYCSFFILIKQFSIASFNFQNRI